MLVDGLVSTVILTLFDLGTSIDGKPVPEEIGEKRRVYFAGGHDAMIASTAKELYWNDNNIVLIEDATLHGTPAIEGDPQRKREGFMEEVNIDNLRFVLLDEFLARFGRDGPPPEPDQKAP